MRLREKIGKKEVKKALIHYLSLMASGVLKGEILPIFKLDPGQK